MELEVRVTFSSMDEAIRFLRGQRAVAPGADEPQGTLLQGFAVTDGTEDDTNEVPDPNEGKPAKPATTKADTDLPPPTRAVKDLIDYFELSAEDVAAMPRSGKGNRITQTDVRNYIAALKAKSDAAKSAAAPAPAPAPEPDPFAEDEAPAAVTYETAKEALKKFNEKKGLQACIEILSRYGVTRLRDLEEKRFGELVTEMGTILEGKA